MISKKDLKTISDLADKFGKLASSMEKFGEAYSRQDFKNNVASVLTGAAIEFYKCRLNDKLNLNHTDRNHWEKEWTYHLGSKLQQIVFTKATIKNKGKALVEAFEETKSNDATYLRVAANVIAKYVAASKQKMNKVLSEKDSEDFYAEVKLAFKEALDLDK